MKSVIVAFVILCTVGLAVWSYSEINTSKETLDEIAELNADIARSKSRLRKLNAEWAYQNRPERLAALALEKFEHLELTVLSRDHFVPLDQVPFANVYAAEPPLAPITTPVEIMNRGAAQ